MFFDDDGTAYFTSTNDDTIIQSTFEPKSGKRTSDIRGIWKGTGGRYPEAPHLYRTHGHYYLWIAEGGTEYGHMETAARSQSPIMPLSPARTIRSSRTATAPPIPFRPPGTPIWWSVPTVARGSCAFGIRLSYRYSQHHHLGRETFSVR